MNYRMYAPHNNSTSESLPKEIMGPYGGAHTGLFTAAVFMGWELEVACVPCVHSRTANGRHRGHMPRTPVKSSGARDQVCPWGERARPVMGKVKSGSIPGHVCRLQMRNIKL